MQNVAATHPTVAAIDAALESAQNEMQAIGAVKLLDMSEAAKANRIAKRNLSDAIDHLIAARHAIMSAEPTEESGS